ncbi:MULTISPECIES: SIR2 family protein [Kosakonia]|uniref:SIR2 family protein n=1 Tax=Kosakonia TaxID=1330547 RepID=UPI002A6B0DE7|nr:SIR2 family protein [Kosakonia sp. CFBP8986]MDY0889632.1 SIR2 family protein [Kosakonia sp. CFBP8986]
MPNKIFQFKNYPIVFIGSGISKRYLQDYPTWEELLNEYWQITNPEMDFYNYLLSIKEKYKNTVFDNSDLDHKIYTEAASKIESDFNKMFTSNAFKLEGLDARRVFSENISPFKYAICQRFANPKLRDNINSNELNSFKSFLKKAKMIITTNYDAFIESLLISQGVTPKLYIGNNGFFEDTVGWSELYKIHGDIKDPLSIIINTADYEMYDSKAILISAKILSNMIKNPILFIGYSLTDRNVKKLLSDFSSQLPKEDGRKSAERIILLQYKPDENEVVTKQITDQQLQVTYTSVETDNYQMIYDEISSVDEGLSPYDVLRYQRAIKTLIVNEGEKGNLNTLLVSPSDLDKLEESVKQGKNLVVALGDKKYVFTQIKELNYLEDYLFEKNEISNKLAIEFITSSTNTLRLPFAKVISSCNIKDLNLPAKSITRLNQRIERHGKLDEIIDSIALDIINSAKVFNRLADINRTELSKQKELLIIIKNIRNFDIKEIESYIKNDLFPQFKLCENNNLKTDYRRLFLAYDLLINGDIKQIR